MAVGEPPDENEKQRHEPPRANGDELPDAASVDHLESGSADAGAIKAESFVPPPPRVDPALLRRSAVEPLLPDAPAQPSPSMITPPTPTSTPTSMPTPPAQPSARGLQFRSDHERNRSVYRRANPWYRQLIRGAVALSLLGGLGVGVYFGARATQDWFDRARLPDVGAETPDFRATSFQIRSTAPAPELEGTLTLDTKTLAFEFVGGPTGPQSGRRVVSADGGAAYLKSGTDAWVLLDDVDPLRQDLRRAVAYLVDDTSADAILINQLRRGYIDLVEEVDEGTGESRLTRYDLLLDTRGFAGDFPLQWQGFVSQAIPGVTESSSLPVTIKLDADNVLVAVTDDQSGWRWQRLDYFDRPASIVNPAGSLVAATPDADGGTTPDGAPTTTVPPSDS